MQIDLRGNVWRSFSTFLRNDSFYYLHCTLSNSTFSVSYTVARSHEVLSIKFYTINTLHTVRFDSNDYIYQCAKKVVSDSPGLVDFAIGLVNSVFNLPDGQVIFFEEFE